MKKTLLLIQFILIFSLMFLAGCDKSSDNSNKNETISDGNQVNFEMDFQLKNGEQLTDVIAIDNNNVLITSEAETDRSLFSIVDLATKERTFVYDGNIALPSPASWYTYTDATGFNYNNRDEAISFVFGDDTAKTVSTDFATSDDIAWIRYNPDFSRAVYSQSGEVFLFKNGEITNIDLPNFTNNVPMWDENGLKFVYAVYNDVLVYDTENMSLIEFREGENFPPTEDQVVGYYWTSFLPDGNILHAAVCETRLELQILDVNDGSLLGNYIGSSDSDESVITAYGDYLLLSRNLTKFDQEAGIYNLKTEVDLYNYKTNELIPQIDVSENIISVDFSADGQHLFAIYQIGTKPHIGEEYKLKEHKISY